MNECIFCDRFVCNCRECYGDVSQKRTEFCITCQYTSVTGFACPIFIPIDGFNKVYYGL